MHKVFSPDILNKDNIDCPDCSWNGKGSDIEQEHLFLTDAIELFCPNCKAYLGFIDDVDS